MCCPLVCRSVRRVLVYFAVTFFFCRNLVVGVADRCSFLAGLKEQDMLKDLPVSGKTGLTQRLGCELVAWSSGWVVRVVGSFVGKATPLLHLYVHTLLPHFSPSLPPRLPPLFFECPVFLKCQVFQMYRFGNPEIVEES